MKINVNKFFLASVAWCLLGIVNIVAQDHKVKPLSHFLETYKEKQDLISKEVGINKGRVSFDKKLVAYNIELNKLKEDFKKKRKAEYQLKSVKRARKSSCKGTHVRRVTDCQSVLLKAPNENMYTKEEWAQVNKEGDEKGVQVFIDSSFVSLKISSVGMKVNKGSVYTIFKYKPQVIAAIVEKETDELFQQITSK